jgi:hypothetical protein
MREAMLIIHFIGLTMGLGTGFAHAFLGVAASKMTPEEATKFRLHSLVLGTMGHIGLGLLIISGLYLITPYWALLTSMPLLMLKLSLVVILAILITFINIYSKRAIKGDPEYNFKKIEPLGKMALLVGLAIIIVAVCIFH